MARGRRRRWNSDKIESAEKKWTGEANIRHARWPDSKTDVFVVTAHWPRPCLDSIDAFLTRCVKQKWKAKIPKGFSFKIEILASKDSRISVISSSASIVVGGCRKFWATRAGVAGLRLQIGGT